MLSHGSQRPVAVRDCVLHVFGQFSIAADEREVIKDMLNKDMFSCLELMWNNCDNKSQMLRIRIGIITIVHFDG